MDMDTNIETVGFKEFWDGLSLEDRHRFAERLPGRKGKHASPGYLYLVALGVRQASGQLARRIDEESVPFAGKRVPRERMRPDIFGGAQ